MATEITKILDGITPEIYNAYMQQYVTENSAFVQSGIAVSDERVSKNITAGGLLVNMPFWNDLGGESEVLGNGDKALETGKITAGADIAAVMYRGRGWATNELTGIVLGSDPATAGREELYEQMVSHISAVRSDVDEGSEVVLLYAIRRAEYDILNFIHQEEVPMRLESVWMDMVHDYLEVTNTE